MRTAPREVYVMIVLRIFLAFSWTTIAAMLTTYLSSAFAYTDTQAAYAYGAWGCAMSIAQFIFGTAIDRLGVRKSLIIGALLTSVGLLLVSLTFENLVFLNFGLFVIVPIGSALGIAVTDIGGLIYSTPANRNVVYSMLYSASNFGVTCAGYVISSAQSKLHDGVSYGDYHATAERLVILAGAISCCMAGLIAALAVRDIDLPVSAILDSGKRPPQTLRERVVHFATTIKNILLDHHFLRMCTFSFCLLGVRQIFRHLDATMPKVLTRQFGEGNSDFGDFYSINPTIVMFLAPFISIFLPDVDIYNLMLFGVAVSSLSPLFVSFDVSKNLYIVFLVVFSIGEVLYSPQSATYIMTLSPKGEQGLYTSLTNAPNFISKIVVGPLSSWELNTYCPNEGADPLRCSIVWRWISGVACTSFVLLLMSRWYIHTEVIRSQLDAQKNEDHDDTSDDERQLTTIQRRADHDNDDDDD